ncbi:hypothetical protein MMC14_003664, partial [Varicellaria rhodocarpa]|nr:hypothetical protein [Varicellaria rhodocarpa]
MVSLATVGQKAVPPHEGIYNTFWAATTPKRNIVSGTFYQPVRFVGSRTRDSENRKLGEQLWTWTQKELER